MIAEKELKNIQFNWIAVKWDDSIRVYHSYYKSYTFKLSVYTRNELYLISAELEITLDCHPNIVIKHQLKRDFATLIEESENFIKGELIRLSELSKIIRFCKTNRLYYRYDPESDPKQLEIKLGKKYLYIQGSSSEFTLQNVVDYIVNYWRKSVEGKGIHKYAKLDCRE